MLEVAADTPGEESEAIFDWKQGEARFRKGSDKRDRRVELGDVEAVVLRGRKQRRTESSGSGRNRRSHSYWVYWCELEAALPGPDARFYKTSESCEDRDAPYEHALPMAVELARALEVPWYWEEYP